MVNLALWKREFNFDDAYYEQTNQRIQVQTNCSVIIVNYSWNFEGNSISSTNFAKHTKNQEIARR